MSLHPGKHAALLHRRNHAVLVDLLDDQRHGAHDGRLDLLHRLHQDARCGRFLNIIDAASDVQRVKHAERHLVGVRHRQDGEPAVVLPGLLGVVGRDDVLAEVAMAEHHAFCLSGSA